MSEVILGGSDYESRLTELANLVKRQQDEVAKMRRSFDDIIYNLDADNMPEVARLILKYRDENRSAVASIGATVNEKDASLRLLVEDYREGSLAAVDAVDQKVAEVNATVAENDASVRLLVENYQEENRTAVDAVDKKVAEVNATVAENDASVRLLVENYQEENRTAVDAVDQKVAEVNATVAENDASVRLLVENYQEENRAAVDAVDQKVAEVNATVAENDASVRLLVENYQEENRTAVDAVDQKVAEVNATVAENDASVRLLVENYQEENRAAVDEVDKKVAEVTATVTENDSSVRLLVENYQEENRLAFDTVDASVASLTATASDNSSKISMLVGQDGQVDGSVIVQAINGRSTVAIAANRINLNGAVTANSKFKVKTDGSVQCKDLTITGGNIEIPCAAGTRDPVLSASDASSGNLASLYSDRLFVGFRENLTDGMGESTTVSPNSVVCRENDEYVSERVEQLGYLTSNGIVLTRTHYDSDGETIDSDDNASIQITPDSITCKSIYDKAVPDSRLSTLKVLYIDKLGTIWAL